jgi:hypothetical protein
MGYNPLVLIAVRDINGKRRSHCWLWDNVCTRVDEHISEDDEILCVLTEDTCLYSGLVNDPITLDDLKGFFA